jgi:hypothetical protein
MVSLVGFLASEKVLFSCKALQLKNNPNTNPAIPKYHFTFTTFSRSKDKKKHQHLLML